MAVRNTWRDVGLAVLALASLPLATGAAQATDDSSARFSMSPSGDGFMRLDKQTGAVSMCERKDGEWACRSLPDDQKALQDRIGKLEQEKRALQDENRRLEDVMGLNPDAPKSGPEAGKPDTLPGPRSGPSLPTEKDVDKAFDYVEGMLKKFRDRLKKLDEETMPPPGAPNAPVPGAPPKPEKPGSTTPL